MSFELMMSDCHPESMSRFDSQPVIAIYFATDRDASELRRIAALDSATVVPSGRVLLGVVDGVVHAAVGVDDAIVIADPFRHTADLIELLQMRSSRIRSGEEPVSAVPTRLLGALRRAAAGGRAALPGRAAPVYRAN